MPGTLPMRRRRRLAPVPCASRFSALISNFMTAPWLNRARDQAPAKLKARSCSFYEQRADRFLGVDAQDGLGEKSRDRKAPDLAAAARVLAPVSYTHLTLPTS